MQKTELKTVWAHPPDELDLKPNQVDVWRINLDLPTATVNSLMSLLSSNESQRAERFRFEKDKLRYIVTHGCLRNILSQYLRCGPEELSFITNDHGKPSVMEHKIEFNLSHSGDFALIAVTRESKVGVDVERLRSDMELESIARRFFSPNEFAELMALPPNQQELAFFNCWTRKEAYIKAQGLGLSLSLNSFDVALIPDEPATLRATRPDAQVAPRWTLLSLHVNGDYAAAVAIEGQDLEIRLWDWNALIR